LKRLSNLLLVAGVVFFGHMAGATPKKGAAKTSSAVRQVSVPYVAGPDIYYVLLESSLYEARLTINGIPVETESRQGSIAIDKRFAFEGGIAVVKSLIVNAYLKPGVNSVEIEFLGGDAYKAAKKSGLLNEEMLQPHGALKVVQIPPAKVTGLTLTMDSLGALLKEGARVIGEFKVSPGLKNAKPSYRQIVDVKIEGKTVKFARVAKDKCKWTTSRPFKVTGDTVHYTANADSSVVVNGKLFETAVAGEYGTSSKRSEYADKFSPGKGRHTVRYEVAKLSKSIPERFEFLMECDLNEAIGGVIAPEAARKIGSSFGNFLNKLQINVWDVVVPKPGVYESVFVYRD
jgi:hypothetical protein